MGTNRAQLASRAISREALGKEAADPAGFAARLRAARSMRVAITWPGTDLQIGLELLSETDRLAAAQASREALTKRGIDHGDPAKAHIDELGAEVWIQVLARALYESADPGAARLFGSADDFRGEVRDVELDALSDAYVELERERSPKLADVSGAALDEFIAAVKKKDSDTWNGIASGLPRNSLLSLVDRLASSLSSSSSNTTPDEVS